MTHGREMISRRELLDRVERLRPSGRQTVLVAVDGRGGAGKSSLAEAIAQELQHVTVIHTDDFALDRGWDWRRLQQQVLEPISRDERGRYQRYDWETKRLAEWHDVPVGGRLVVEGVSSTRHELGDVWDLRVWVECATAERLRRALERDGAAMMPTWVNVWEVGENQYVNEQSPDKRADVVVDGNADT